MLIVKIQGGLGNQMFEYALAKYLEAAGKNVKIYLGHYSDSYKGSEDAIHNGYELQHIFTPTISVASKKEVLRYARVNRDLLSRALNKVLGTRKTHIRQEDLNKKYCYFPQLKDLKNAYLDGYWNSFLYADEVKSSIMREFKFKNKLSDRNVMVAKHIKDTISISLHIRHGDYLKLQDRYAIPTVEYYISAIAYFQKRFKDARFFCFSDDIEWCKKYIDIDNIEFIDWNTGRDSYVDMQLMSLCKHNIVANSTFSMWAAWLNTYEEKIVIRPEAVFVDADNEKIDMWPKEWISLQK